MAPTFLLLTGLLWLLLVLLLRRAETNGNRRAWLPASADLLAGGLLFVLTLGYFWRTLSGDVFQPADGGDLASFLFPTWRFAAGELAAGRLPLWNPTLYGGMPFVGDIQAGFFYPPHLILFLLRPDFPYTWLQASAILHLYWAGLGTYVFLRTLRLPQHRQLHPAAALFGALAFALSDPLLIHLGNLNLIAALSWLPWTVAAIHRALHTSGRRRWLWTSAAALLYAQAILAGHAQSVLYVGLALGLYCFGWAIWSDSEHAGLARRAGIALGLAAATAGLAALLAAPALLPALAHIPLTARAGFTYQDTVGYSLAPAQLIGLLTPGFFGRGPGLFWGLWQRVETPYLGVAGLLFAVAALLLSRRNERRLLYPFVGMATAGLLLGFGIYALVHGWFTALLPFFGQMRAPARALVLWAFGVSALAGIGADMLARLVPDATASGLQALRSLLRHGTLVMVGVVLPLFFLALLLTQESETAFLRSSVALLALVWAAIFWLATWLLVEARTRIDANSDGTQPPSARLAPQPFLALAVALLFFDLAATGAYTDISPDDPTASFDHKEIVAHLHAQAAESGPFRIDTATDIQGLWQPDAAALHGLEDVGGVANPLALSLWSDTWQATGGRDSARYQLLNVRYVIARDGTPLPDNFSLALDAPGELSLYLNGAYFPRAFLSREEDGLLVPDPTAPPVQFGRRSPNHIQVQASPAAEAILVFSEIDAPGWRATVDGAPVTIERVNGFQRGVRLAAGEVTVEMRYVPPGWRWVWPTFGAGVLMAAALLVLGWSVRSTARLD